MVEISVIKFPGILLLGKVSQENWEFWGTFGNFGNLEIFGKLLFLTP